MGDDEGECKRSDESRKKDEERAKRCKGGREEGAREWEKEGLCSGAVEGVAKGVKKKRGKSQN